MKWAVTVSPMMSSAVTKVLIEEGMVEDLPFVLQLYAENESTQEDVLEVPDARAIWERFSAYPDYKLYVARIAGEIVGTFALLIMDNLAHRGAKSGVVEDVIVATRFQRHGIGKQMMRFALDRCREAGCYKLTLSSNLKRTPAHSFYESLGFVKHGYSFIAALESNNHSPKTR
jgi:GNAT superfamily N-acetyltransferase